MGSSPSPSPSPSSRPSSAAYDDAVTEDNSNDPTIPAPIHAPTSNPLPLTASLHLSALPTSTASALALAARTTDLPLKVTIRFQPVGSAPMLKQRVFKVASEQRFESVVSFLGRRLGKGKGGGAEGVFCYVNSVFAPGLDEGVGELWRCFKTGDELVVAYAVTPAFG